MNRKKGCSVPRQILWPGSDLQLKFPKAPPPARPLSAPTRRNLDEELAQLEEALEGLEFRV